MTSLRTPAWEAMWRRVKEKRQSWKERLRGKPLPPSFSFSDAFAMTIVEKGQGEKTVFSFTAVSTKVVPRKSKSARDNEDWHYG